jgi:hypothetical protein
MMRSVPLASQRVLNQINLQLWGRSGLCLHRLTGCDRLVRIEVQPDRSCLASGRLAPITLRQWQSLLLVLGWVC